MLKSNRRHTLFAHNKYRKKDNKGMDFDDFFKKATILPNKQKPNLFEQEEEENVIQSRTDQEHTTNNAQNEQAEAVTETTVDESEILKGVIACIDVRTEDGDNVSHKFESAIHSMGGETRKIFSDTVTHFVFKNGSNATLKKAMNKGVFIINLLWISRCKIEGKRLDEKDFLFEQPLSLVLASKRRPKSMKPSKVKGLTNNTDQDEEVEMDKEAINQPYSSILFEKRYTSDLSELRNSAERARKRQRTEEELDLLEDEIEKEESEKMIPKKPILSAENIADRHNMDKITSEQNAEQMEVIFPSTDESVKNNIKASFSIGQHNTHSDTSVDLRKSLSIPKTKSSPLKRKRKLTTTTVTYSNTSSNNINSKQELEIESETANKETNNLKAVATISPSTLSRLTRELTLSPPEPMRSSSLSSLSSQSSLKIPYNDSNPNVVFTSLSQKARIRCTNIVNRLGKFEIATEVNENTTHVIVGQQRRTKSVVLGLLRGAYLVKPEWLYDVEDEHNYTPESYYELSNWLPALVKRKSTQLLSSSTHVWVESALSGIELIQDFVELAGGTVVFSRKEADIIISEDLVMNSQKPIVGELWIYESIDAWKVLPVEGYLKR